jgi:arabinose-5-phosphate isomerase
VARETARRVLEVEAKAVADLVGRLDESFDRAVTMLAECRGRIVVTGMGKSGIIAQKIAATLASTGTPAYFMHPVEAIHGDLGMIVRGDVVVALSQSGETAEILGVVETVRRLQGKLLVMTGRAGSTLGREADLLLDTSVAEEGCPLGLAPMASTTAMAALGDALAAALMVAKGFSEEDFARLHPGGRLGRRLARVRQFMHTGEAVPRVGPATTMGEVVLEMSRKRLGSTAVVDEAGRLLGIVTDGDLRRLLQRDATPLDRTAAEAMTARPTTIAADALASAALALMEERKITMLPVVAADGTLEGIVQIHDLWGTQLF